MEFWRSRLAVKYIFFEMLPVFLVGIFIFIFIILMFQSFRLTEYVLVHGADYKIVFKILVYLSVSFLPVVLPMSLLFSILLTYGRMSSDSEVVAFRSIGLSLPTIITPALILSAITTLVSLQTAFNLAPWGNRQTEVLVHKLGSLKPGATIREGVFSEGFFNLVVYANKVDSKTGDLKKIFIYDERDAQSPMTIIAQEGRLLSDLEMPGHKAFLRLFDGNIHKTRDSVYTKIDFKSYDINLSNPLNISQKEKTLLSYNLKELKKALKDKTITGKKHRLIATEYHRRWAIAFACIVFSLIGVGMGTTSNRRNTKSSGFVISVGIVIFYWVIYASFEGLAKSGVLPVALSIWLTNIILGVVGLWSLRRAMD